MRVRILPLPPNFRKDETAFREKNRGCSQAAHGDLDTEPQRHRVVLDEFEATHNDWECDQSKQYAALVAGHFALKEAIDEINNRLNK